MAERHVELDLERVTVATVVDDRPPYVDEVAYLFESLDLFGGTLRRARRRAYFVDRVSAETERVLARLGVAVQVVGEVEPRFRFANKLAMVAGEAAAGTDLLVALDSDILVAGDFGDYLESDLVQAKPPDGDLLGFEAWAELFGHFGLELPSARHPTSLEPHWTHAYFNTGVLMIPGAVLQPLHDRWLHFIRALLDSHEIVEGLADRLRGRVPEYEGATSEGLEHLFFAEQWAFSLARHELALPYAVLPLALNFPLITHEAQEPGRYVQERFSPDTIRPLLIHHHHRFEPVLPRTGYDRPDEVIADIDSRLFGRAPCSTAAPAGE